MKKALLIVTILSISGCYNTYKVHTLVVKPGETEEQPNLLIRSEVTGKGTIRQAANVYKDVVEFVNKSYLKK